MPYIKKQIVNEIYNDTQYHNYKFFEENLAGHITNRITEGARSFEMVLSIFSEKIVRLIAIIIFGLIAMYLVHQKFANIFLIWIYTFMAIGIICSTRINKYSVNYARSKSIVAGNIVDAIANIGAILINMNAKISKLKLIKL